MVVNFRFQDGIAGLLKCLILLLPGGSGKVGGPVSKKEGLFASFLSIVLFFDPSFFLLSFFFVLSFPFRSHCDRE